MGRSEDFDAWFSGNWLMILDEASTCGLASPTRATRVFSAATALDALTIGWTSWRGCLRLSELSMFSPSAISKSPVHPPPVCRAVSHEDARTQFLAKLMKTSLIFLRDGFATDFSPACDRSTEKWHSIDFDRCLSVCQGIMYVTQVPAAFHCIFPPSFCGTRFYQDRY